MRGNKFFEVACSRIIICGSRMTKAVGRLIDMGLCGIVVDGCLTSSWVGYNLEVPIGIVVIVNHRIWVVRWGRITIETTRTRSVTLTDFFFLNISICGAIIHPLTADDISTAVCHPDLCGL